MLLTVAMAGVIYASVHDIRTSHINTRSSLYPTAPRAVRSSDELYHSGDVVCATAANALVYSMPTDLSAPAEVIAAVPIVLTASAGQQLRVISAHTHDTRDGARWIEVSAAVDPVDSATGRGRSVHGYASLNDFAPCSDRVAGGGFSAEDVDAIARAMYFETHALIASAAQNQSPLTSTAISQMEQAIGWSVINRARDSLSRWPKSPAAVVHARGQYFWNSASPKPQQPRSVAVAEPTERDLESLRVLARDCLSGQRADTTAGAQYFWPVGSTVPDWARDFISTGSVGALTFYRKP